MPNNTQQKLSLGNVNFFRFEVPDELPNLFGVQKVAVHDFAGGNRTLQQLGAFPFPSISWHGVFFDGDTVGTQGTAINRASQLNTMRVTAQPVPLLWGPFQYSVIVTEFEIIGKLKQQLEYKIKVVPLVDNTTTSNTPPSQSNATAVAGDAATGVTNATQTALATLLPSVILVSAQTIVGNATGLITNNGGSVSNIPQSQQTTLQAQIAALQLLLQPIINGTDYGQSSAAITLSTSLYTLGQTMQVNTSVPITTITVTNPSLPVLASQYYGDDSLWTLIAQANNLQDMFPLGTLTLVIPPTTTQSSFIPNG